MPRIVVLDNLSQDGLDMMKNAGIEYEVRTGLKGEDLRQTLLEFDGAICRSGVKITAESLEGNRRLKAIARAGVGVDNIDLKAATKNGIIVMNTPGGNTNSTAEQTWTLMLALSRNTAPAYQSLIEGRWDRKKFTGHQLCGKTLGIIGMGRIGQVVSRYARAFGMNVIAFDPFLPKNRAEELGVKMFDTVDAMLPDVDYLTVHTPLNDQTRNLIDKPQIALLKDGACLINCARGGIYNMDALLEGLQSGKLGGVALDVYPEEPYTECPLFGMPHVLCTPHLGASTEEAQTNVALEAVQLVIDYLSKGIIKQAVNFSALDPETLKDLRGWLDTAYRLGLLARQVTDGPISACKICYKGEISKKNTKLVTGSFAAGLLTAATGSDVSIVAALPMMDEYGIKLVQESSNEVADFSSLMTVELTTEKGTVALGGTIFGNTMPRLILKDGLRLEAYLDGHLVLFEHQDVAGVIGQVGNITAKNNINIAHLSVGRCSDKPGTVTLGILSLDSVPAPSLATEMEKIDEIKKVTLVELPNAGEYPAWMA